MLIELMLNFFGTFAGLSIAAFQLIDKYNTSIDEQRKIQLSPVQHTVIHCKMHCYPLYNALISPVYSALFYTVHCVQRPVLPCTLYSALFLM